MIVCARAPRRGTSSIQASSNTARDIIALVVRHFCFDAHVESDLIAGCVDDTADAIDDDDDIDDAQHAVSGDVDVAEHSASHGAKLDDGDPRDTTAGGHDDDASVVDGVKPPIAVALEPVSGVVHNESSLPSGTAVSPHADGPIDEGEGEAGAGTAADADNGIAISRHTSGTAVDLEHVAPKRDLHVMPSSRDDEGELPSPTGNSSPASIPGMAVTHPPPS